MVIVKSFTVAIIHNEELGKFLLYLTFEMTDGTTREIERILDQPIFTVDLSGEEEKKHATA